MVAWKDENIVPQLDEKITQLYCSDLLLESGWAQDKTLEINSVGMIAAIHNGKIKTAEVAPGPVISGIANLHSHAFQRALAGLTEVASLQHDHFWSWRERMYAFLQKLNADDLFIIASYLYIEMLEAGYTSVAEFHYLHHDIGGKHYSNPAELSEQVIQAALNAGIAITHLPVFYAYANFNAEPATKHQSRFVHNIDQFQKLLNQLEAQYKNNPQVNLGLAPHSLRAVSAHQLRELMQLADELPGQAPIHIHIAEQQKEVDDCLASHAQRPVDYLMSKFTVDERWCLVHATHMTTTEMQAVAKSKAVVGLCPSTEANLGDGVFLAQNYWQAGGCFGIGSDSHISVNLVDEIRSLEYSQRLLLQQRNCIAEPGQSVGMSLLQQIGAGGAQALARPTGRIATNCMADLIVLDSRPLQGLPAKYWLDYWIFASGRPMINDVYVAGRKCVSEGKHSLRETAAMKYHKVLSRLLN